MFKKHFGKKPAPPSAEPTPVRPTLTADKIKADNVVVGQQVINNYIQSGGQQTDEKALAVAVSDYLAWVQRHYKNIPLHSYHPDERRMKPLPMEAAHVPFGAIIEAASEVPPEEIEDWRARLARLGGQVLLDHVLMLPHTLVLIGAPGSGKSVALLRLAHLLAEGIAANTSTAADVLALH